MSDRRAGLSAEAVGQTRIALASIRRQHEDFMRRAMAVPPSIASDLAFKTTAGRDLAWKTLHRLVPGQPIMETNRAAIYRLVRPRVQPLSDPTMTHDGVEVAALCYGLSRGHAVIEDAPHGLFVTFHALGRAYERTNPHVVDMRALVIEAHDNLLNAPNEIFNTAHQEKSWALPAGSGAFLCHINVVSYHSTDTIVFLRANTFVSHDMLDEAQENQVRACLYPTEGARLRNGLLLPQHLRSAVLPIGGFVALPRDSTITLSASRVRSKANQFQESAITV